MLTTLALLSTLLADIAPPVAPIDLIERLFGASNVAWVTGNGGLTIGLSPLGDASVVSWPSPSYTDQLLHLGSNAPDVRMQRSFAAHPAMGAFVGVRVHYRDGHSVVAFPRSDWTITQRRDDMPVVLTHMVPTSAIGVTVDVRDWVERDRDAWVRDVTVTKTRDDVTGVDVLGYWNLSPTLSRVPQLPIADWAMDAYNDYAALWDAQSDAVIHFRPAGRGDITSVTDLIARPAIDYGAVGAALASGAVDAAGAATIVASDALDDAGVYFAIGAREPLAGHQIGFDTTPTCQLIDDLADNVSQLPVLYPGLTLPLDPAIVDVLRCDKTAASIAAEQGWSALPTSAYEDLADGDLQGSFASAGQVDEALVVAAPEASDGTWQARFVIGAGADKDAARASLTVGRAADLTTTKAAWKAELDHVKWPQDAGLRAASERAIGNLLLAQDRHTGAIVASVARQPPYALDWPRDGAFFDFALDAAGLGERATKHARYTLTTPRTMDVDAEAIINSAPPPDPDDPQKAVFPAAAWEMNSYADGLVGGNIRWEIDNTALAVWTLVEHGERLPAAEQAAWRDDIWPVVSAATDLLARWRDAATGLPAPANEDDNAAYTQTLHGAVTTWRGIQSAAELADRKGEASTAARWHTRADELKAAIDTHLREPNGGLYREGLDAAQNPGNAAGGASAWALWPAGLDVPAGQIDKLLDLVELRLDPANGGGAYVTKLILAAAMRGDAAEKARALVLLKRFVATNAWLGETFVSDGTTFDPRVANPHVWAGTLVYLSSITLDPAEPASQDAAGGGCAGGSAALVGWLAALALVARRAVMRVS